MWRAEPSKLGSSGSDGQWGRETMQRGWDTGKHTRLHIDTTLRDRSGRLQWWICQVKDPASRPRELDGKNIRTSGPGKDKDLLRITLKVLPTL